MHLQLAHISPRRDRLKSSGAHQLILDYVARAGRFTPTSLTGYESEEHLLGPKDRRGGRTPRHIILLDSRGRQHSSEQFASTLLQLRDTGTQEVLLAIGPANGWSSKAREAADLLLSLGPMTLPHELALVLLAEQTYRALTILANHPYHTGHE